MVKYKIIEVGVGKHPEYFTVYYKLRYKLISSIKLRHDLREFMQDSPSLTYHLLKLTHDPTIRRKGEEKKWKAEVIYRHHDLFKITIEMNRLKNGIQNTRQKNCYGR